MTLPALARLPSNSFQWNCAHLGKGVYLSYDSKKDVFSFEHLNFLQRIARFVLGIFGHFSPYASTHRETITARLIENWNHPYFKEGYAQDNIARAAHILTQNIVRSCHLKPTIFNIAVVGKPPSLPNMGNTCFIAAALQIVLNDPLLLQEFNTQKLTLVEKDQFYDCEEFFECEEYAPEKEALDQRRKKLEKLRLEFAAINQDKALTKIQKNSKLDAKKRAIASNEIAFAKAHQSYIVSQVEFPSVVRKTEEPKKIESKENPGFTSLKALINRQAPLSRIRRALHQLNSDIPNGHFQGDSSEVMKVLFSGDAAAQQTLRTKLILEYHGKLLGPLTHFDSLIREETTIEMPFISLSLIEGKKQNLEDLLKTQFFDAPEEPLSDHRTHSTIREKRRYNSAPERLIIDLKRFTNRNTKIYDPVAIGSDCIVNLQNETAASYQLAGYICHSSSKTNFGHYFAYVRKETPHGDLFWKCNDSQITQVSAEEFLKEAENAYLLNLRRLP